MNHHHPTTPDFVTDGGLETDLIFHHGVDLPEFAAFPLLDDERGPRAARASTTPAYADVAARAGAAAPARDADLAGQPRLGRAARLRRRGAGPGQPRRGRPSCATSPREPPPTWAVAVGGMIGPRGDGYAPARAVDPDEAADYHRPQLGVVRRGRRRPGHRAHPHRRRRGDRRRPRPPPRWGCRSASRSRSRPTAGCPAARRSPTAIAAGRRRHRAGLLPRQLRPPRPTSARGLDGGGVAAADRRASGPTPRR